MIRPILLIATMFIGFTGVSSAADDSAAIHRGAAKAFYCTGCHGYNGMGTLAVSELAGIESGILLGKLMDYKKRNSPLKRNLLEKFDDNDINEIAIYFASLKKTDRGVVSYSRDIEPLVSMRCISCHSTEGAGKEAVGLDLTSYDALMKGESGRQIDRARFRHQQ